MKYSSVCVESLGYLIPEEVVTSAEIEQRLQPTYRRLRLPEGRLELMSGIRERRFWPVGTRIAELSSRSCQLALQAADWDPSRVGALIHGSVCRDFLEPATATPVHHALGLPPECLVYDTSNACLGLLNGMVQAANMIELGQIQSALVVGSESGRSLVEGTIAAINGNPSLTRHQTKTAFASLTIGSASCAILLTHASLSKSGNRLCGGAARAHTQFHDLCRSDVDQAGAAMQPLMDTDSEQLMAEGIRTGQATFGAFLGELNWERNEIDRTFCHQVGSAHHKLMLQSLQLDPANDCVTFPWLGNTGSAALPVTLAVGASLQPSSGRFALLGIGSGINCLMLGVEWRRQACAGRIWGTSERPLDLTAIISRPSDPAAHCSTSPELPLQ